MSIPDLPTAEWQILNTLLLRIEADFSKYVLVLESVGFKHQMFLKIVRNYFSMNQIEQGMNLEYNGKQVHIKDYSSLLAILRNLLETFLLYHHIFCASNDPLVINFRLDCWVRQGIMTRKAFLAKLGRTITDEEMVEFEQIKKRLDNHPLLSEITKGNLNKFNQYGKWIFTTESTRLKAIGLNKEYSDIIYQYLSSHSHVESGGLRQIWYMDLENKTNEACRIILIHTILVVYSFLGFFIDDNQHVRESLDQEMIEHIHSWKNVMVKNGSG